jgi:hypothetical protein
MLMIHVSQYKKMAGFCEHRDEHSDSIKDEE